MRAATAKRIVVAVDPSVTSKRTSDEVGIVVVAEGTDGYGYVLDDLSDILSPLKWATRVADAYDGWDANCVVAEGNQGGEMVISNIHTVDPTIPVKIVHARRGKEIRADPVVALYEQQRIFHVRKFPELEHEMTHWSPGDTRSPSRLDALVWGVTFLFILPRKRGSVGFA